MGLFVILIVYSNTREYYFKTLYGKCCRPAEQIMAIENFPFEYIVASLK